MGGLGMAVAFWMTGRRDPSLELKLEASEVGGPKSKDGRWRRRVLVAWVVYGEGMVMMMLGFAVITTREVVLSDDEESG